MTAKKLIVLSVCLASVFLFGADTPPVYTIPGGGGGDAIHLSGSGDPNVSCSGHCACENQGKDRYIDTATAEEWYCSNPTTDTWIKTASAAGDLSEADIDTSSELRTIITDESGTGSILFQGGDLGSSTFTQLSNGANPADAGVIRLPDSQKICWETSGAGNDTCIYGFNYQVMVIDGILSGTQEIAGYNIGNSGTAPYYRFDDTNVDGGTNREGSINFNCPSQYNCDLQITTQSGSTARTGPLTISTTGGATTLYLGGNATEGSNPTNAVTVNEAGRMTNIGSGFIEATGIKDGAVSTRPGSPEAGSAFLVTDGANGSDCSTGAQRGSSKVLCFYNGSSWVPVPLAQLITDGTDWCIDTDLDGVACETSPAEPNLTMNAPVGVTGNETVQGSLTVTDDLTVTGVTHMHETMLAFSQSATDVPTTNKCWFWFNLASTASTCDAGGVYKMPFKSQVTRFCVNNIMGRTLTGNCEVELANATDATVLGSILYAPSGGDTTGAEGSTYCATINTPVDANDQIRIHTDSSVCTPGDWDLTAFTLWGYGIN